jgi:hypothetical protein
MTVRTARIRIEDLSPLETLTEQEMAEISGAGRKGKWQFSGQSMEVLEVRQVMSAVTVALTPENQSTVNNAVHTATGVDPTVPEQMVPAVLQALQQVRQQAASLQNGTGQIAFNSDAARQQFIAALDGILGSQMNNATSSSLQAAGITVISRASASEISGFLTNGTAASQDLLVLRLQRSTTETLTVTATETDQLSMQGKTIAASVTGTLSGSLKVEGDLVFGLNASGRAFVREGSSVSASTNIKGALSASANPNSQVGVALSGAGHFTGGSQYVVNDGDTVGAENLYLDMDALFSDFATNTTITGDMDFDGVTASLTVPGMSNPINVPATFEWNPIENTGNITIDENAVEDAILDGVAKSVDQALEQLSERTHVLTDRLGDIPVIGDEIENDVTNRLQSLLDVDVPDDGVRSYLEDRGFQINSTIGFQDLIEGNLGDLFVVTWHRHEVGSTISRTGSGTFGKGGVQFDVAGNFTVQPEYNITVTFGVDAVGGLFIQEGSAVELTVSADGNLDGSAKIPNLVNVHVSASAPEGQHVVDASLLASVNDGDAQAGERLYATNLSTNAFAVAFDSSIQVDAKMSVDSPVQQLPSWIQSTLNGLLPDSISWTAGVSYDFVTGDFQYNINDTSLTDIVTAFQGADGVEDALKNYMLDRIAENNPIPESTQQFLGTKIPLLDQNVMDLLDIPKAMQYVIAPLAFRGQAAPSVPGDTLDIRFDLFNAANIGRMLSGQTYDIVSLDIDQRFEKDMAKITVIPETVVASYLGIVNATVEVNLTPGFFFDINMLTGIDSLGFYIEGVQKDTSAKDIEPNFKLGGKLEARVIVEGDILLLVDFLRVTGTVGIEAYGDMTFVSPHPDTLKVRVGDINPDQIVVGLGVDLTLQMQGEVGLVEYDQWDKDVFLYGNSEAEHRVIPLYRSNKVSLADIQDQLAEYKERLKSQGKQVVFAAAAATHDPHFVAAAIGIIYNDSGMGETVRKLVVDFNMRVDQAAEALSKAGKKISEIAAPLWEHCNNDLNKFAGALKAAGAKIGEVATEVWSRAGGDLNKLAAALKAAEGSIGEIAGELWNRAGGDLNKLGAGLKAAGGRVGEIATELWNRAGNDLNKLATGLKSAGASVSEIATEVWNRAGGSLNRLASALKAAGASTGEIADEIWKRSGSDLNKLAGALQSIGAGLGDIGTQIWNRAGGDLNKLAGALVSVGDSARGVAQALGRVSSDVSRIAQALNSRVSGNLSTIAEAMWSISWTTARNIAGGLGAVTRDASAIASAISSKVTSNLSSIADAMYRGIGWTSYRDVAAGLGGLTRSASSIAGAISGALGASLSTIADAMYRGIGWTSYRDVAAGLGGLTRSASSIAGAMSGALGASYSTIADAMYRGISWTSYRDVAAGLGSLTRSASSIAGALRNTLGASFGTISDAMWHGISWTSHRDVAAGLGSVTRDASAIAGALRNSIGASFQTIADAMYRGISWTSYTDVGRGLRAVTSDANVIASALRNGAGAADSTIRGVLQSVGNGAANLNNAINSVSNAVNSAANTVNNVISSIARRPW